MLVSDILWALVGGTVVGLLGKWLGPGDREAIPLWLTILCGIGGVLLGNLAYTSVFAPTTPGPDWWRHVWQVAGAVALVAVAATVTGRRQIRP